MIVLDMGNCIGRGSHADVYEAWMRSGPDVERQVAVKVLRSRGMPIAQLARRFRDEARVLARLSHPGVLKVLELTRLQGSPAIITEYVPGHTLDAHIEAAGRDVRAVLEALADAADTLDACHRATDRGGEALRVIHRDVKPANVLVARRSVKVIDLGVASFEGSFREVSSYVDSGVTFGSVPFMAPEQFAPGTRPAPAWDVFALGATAFTCLSGQVLDDRPRSANRDAWMRYLRDKLAGAMLFRPVLGVISGCLSPDPVDRPAMDEVVVALEQAAESASGVGLRRWSRAVPFAPPELDGPLAHQRLEPDLDEDVTLDFLRPLRRS